MKIVISKTYRVKGIFFKKATFLICLIGGFTDDELDIINEFGIKRQIIISFFDEKKRIRNRLKWPIRFSINNISKGFFYRTNDYFFAQQLEYIFMESCYNLNTVLQDIINYNRTTVIDFSLEDKS